jgi:hypothetical protein
MYKGLKTLAGFEPGIFCSGGGRDDHYATPPGHQPKNVSEKDTYLCYHSILESDIIFTSFR